MRPYQKPSKGYTVTIWADGFRRWHTKATFTEPMGNTPEAQRILENARLYCRRNLRRIIAENDSAGKGWRMKLEVKANQVEPGTGRLLSVTWAEATA